MMIFLVVVVVLFIIAAVAHLIFEVRFPHIVQVSIPTSKLPARQGMRVLQVADLHNMRLRDEFMEKVKGTKPDLIAVTGDLINGREKNFHNVFRLVEQLRDICPHIFFVSGNNDWEHRRYEELRQGLQERGVVTLNNRNTTFSHGSLLLNIVGVDDPSTKMDDVRRAFDGLREDADFTLFLAHDPLITRWSRGRDEAQKADLVLCGHTHGGQIRLPFIGALVAPGQGLFPRLDKGVFQLPNDTTLYIDSGLGTSVVPIRFCNRSQVTLLQVEGTKQEETG